MTLFSVIDTASSALAAQSIRLNTTSSNIANASSISSSIDQTYRARHPVFAADLNSAIKDQSAVGVKVLAIVQSDAPLKIEYMPNHPIADENGYIYKPNVNVVEETADMISASKSYQTNLRVADMAKQMLMKTLELGK